MIGGGKIGGKAQGLVFLRDMLDAELSPDRFPGIEVTVPAFEVLGTDLFDEFVARNDLEGIDESGATDNEIARRFLAGRMPDEALEGLVRIAKQESVPLAVRSSSVLEDAIFSPFAGVYQTRMLPNSRGTTRERLVGLDRAVRLVWASTFFSHARAYLASTGRSREHERMAVIVQQVVGTPHGHRFYPELSGVGRSHDFYPVGSSRAEDGVILLALGLGKQIVDGALCWSYSPARPSAPPPFATIGGLLCTTQLSFWALDLTGRADAETLEEGEFLECAGLDVAERDGTLALVGSTYDPRSDRLVAGVSRPGPRAIDFAPLLRLGNRPINDALRELLSIGERAAGSEVEIEFAAAIPLDAKVPVRLGLLQVRPMFVSHEEVAIDEGDWRRSDVVISSERVLGNGGNDEIRDIVYVRPERFDAGETRQIATEIGQLNSGLTSRGSPYLLIGFGRWGSADPWLGIPVQWDQISGARVLVEATLETLDVEPSQGSHFFHNLSSFGVLWFGVSHRALRGVNWDWLDGLEVAEETERVRHVRTSRPLTVRVDGRDGRGAVWSGDSD